MYNIRIMNSKNFYTIRSLWYFGELMNFEMFVKKIKYDFLNKPFG